MDYAMIGKIEKAKRYAEERDRIDFTDFRVQFNGENSVHSVTYSEGEWNCNCGFFHSRGVCSHTMALERILDQMIANSSLTAETK